MQGVQGTLGAPTGVRQGDEGAGAETEAASRSGTYYRYEDGSGRVTIVDSLSKLPADLRTKAVRIDLPGGSEALQASDTGSDAQQSAGGGVWDRISALNLDAGSFGMGLGAGLVAATVLFVLFGRGAGPFSLWLLRGVLSVGMVLMLVGGYLSMVRGSVAPNDTALTSPIQLVRDAQKTMDQVRQLRDAQEQQLKDIEKMSK